MSASKYLVDVGQRSQWLWEFSNDRTLHDEFLAFKLEPASFTDISVLTAVLTSLFVLYWTLVLLVESSWMLYLAMAVCFVLMMAPLWLLLLLLFLLLPKRNTTNSNDQYLRARRLFETMSVIGFPVSAGIVLLIRGYFGQCQSSKYLHQWSCFPGEIVGSIPPDHVAVIFLVPFLMTILMPTVTAFTSLTALLIGTVFVATAGIVANAGTSASFVFVVLMLMVFLYFNFFNQRVQLFLHTAHYRAMILQREEERMSEAERFVREIRTFLSGVSHDLKTPMVPLSCGVDLLQIALNEMASLVGESAREQLLWLNSALRGLETAQQLLLMALGRCTDYCRICSKLPLIPNVRRVRVGKSVTEAIKFAADIVPFLSTDYQSEYEDDLLQFMALHTDPMWLVESIVTLLTLDQQQTRVKLRVSQLLSRDVSHIRFSRTITDGQNFDDFGPIFSSSDFCGNSKTRTTSVGSPRSSGGIGIELLCLHKRMKAIDGLCGCECVMDDLAPSEGRSILTACEHKNPEEHPLCIWFAIPCNQDGIDGGFSSTASLSQLRVLVIDDTRSVLKMLRMVLERKGHQVWVASQGLEALQLLHSLDFQIDAILLDLQMPVMDGYSTVKSIRESEKRRRNLLMPILVIAMSAGNDEDTLSRVSESGFDGFLPKPFRIDAFERIWKEYQSRPKQEE